MGGGWGSFEKMHVFVGGTGEQCTGVNSLLPLWILGMDSGCQAWHTVSAKTILLTEVCETGSCSVVLESLAFNSQQSAILPPECWDYSHELLLGAQNVLLLLFGSRG